MIDRSRLRLVLLSLIVFLCAAAPLSSTAFLTDRAASQASFSAAPDWTPPSAAMLTPTSPLKGTVSLQATATDGETGVSAVQVQYLAPGASSWASACSSSSPSSGTTYTCSWNTTGFSDGVYELRARVTDNASFVTLSSQISVTLANNLLVILNDPGREVRGSVPLTATIYNPGSLVYRVTMEYTVNGAAVNWRSITGCSNLVGLNGTYSCTWATSSPGDGTYDLRATASVVSNTASSAPVTDVTVDNSAPTVAMTDPGSPLSGARTLSATSSDSGTGLSNVSIQSSLNGTGPWTTLCSMITPPYSCSYNTVSLANGTYSLRAVATDQVGNTTTSTVVANRIIDNTISSVSLTDPGAFLAGSVNLQAIGNSTAGITSIRIDRSPAGLNTWTPVCTDTTSPYACPFNTTSVADGLYDLRAVLTAGNGATITSSTVTNRRVDNSPLRGYDVQAANGGGTAGKLDTGDTVTLTYTREVNLSTIRSGWTGAGLAVTVRLRDGNLLGGGNQDDTLDVLVGSTAVNLGTVNLKAEAIKSNRTGNWNATMTAVTSSVNGVPVTRVVLTITSFASGQGSRTWSTLSNSIWTPSSLAQDLTGRASSAAPTTELGTLDRDL